MRGTSAHVVAVVAPTVVVGDEPGVRLGLELADGAEVPAVKSGAPALMEHGALETLADGVVVGRAGRDSDVAQSLGRQGVDEGAGDVLGPVVGQDRPHRDPVTAIEPQRMVDESGAHGTGGRTQHDGDHGEAGEDIDGGELVALAHALELADVEAVEADELARTARGQAEPEGLVFALGVWDHQPGGRRCNGRRFGQALGSFAQSVGHQVLLPRRLGDGEPLVP